MSVKAAVRERGIIFSGESVRAILADQKTQTRRVIKEQPIDATSYMRLLREGDFAYRGGDVWGCFTADDSGTPGMYGTRVCPYGAPGDRLYVKEAWRTFERPDDLVDGVLFEADGAFRAIENSREAAERWIEAHANGKHGDRWRSPLYMPRDASRLTLEITEIRAERLQAITEEDARAEGVVPLDGGPEDEDDRDWSICPKCGGLRVHNALGADYGVIFDVDCTDCDTYRKRFRHRWNSLHARWKPRKVLVDGGHITEYVCYPWSEEDVPQLPLRVDPANCFAYPNPWVWPIGFKRVTP